MEQTEQTTTKPKKIKLDFKERQTNHQRL